MGWYEEHYEGHYKDINESLDIIEKWADRGRIMGQTKEKYLSTRWYAYLGTELGLNTIFYPRHMYYRFPKWTYPIDSAIKSIFKYTGIQYLFVKWQVFCYRQAYKEVLRKYPKVDHSIDHEEILDPNIVNIYHLQRSIKYLEYKLNKIQKENEDEEDSTG